MPQYSKQQILKLYKNLPEELKDALEAESTMQAIEKYSKQYQFSAEQTSKLVDLIRNVLLGLLPVNEFEQELEKELKLKKPIVKKIAFEIQRFIFYPVRKSLSEIYKTEIGITPGLENKPKSKPKKRTMKKDSYREPIEQS